eukprot:9494949-Pyramimonas_sp.AAC.1
MSGPARRGPKRRLRRPPGGWRSTHGSACEGQPAPLERRRTSVSARRYLGCWLEQDRAMRGTWMRGK